MIIRRIYPCTEGGVEAISALSTISEDLKQASADFDRSGHFAASSIQLLKEAGIFAACVPKSLGGFGVVSLHDTACITAAVAECDPSAAIGLAMHLGLSWYFARGLRCAPSSQFALQHREVLYEIGGRKAILASAVAEPGAAPWELNTTAVKDKGLWHINGTKTIVSMAPAATHFYTRMSAETSDGMRQATAMLKRESAGISIKDNWDGLGMRASGSGQVNFLNVKLAENQLILRGPWGTRDAIDGEGRSANALPIMGVYIGIAQAIQKLILTDMPTATPMSTATRWAKAQINIELGGIRSAFFSASKTCDDLVSNIVPKSMEESEATELLANTLTAWLLIERGLLKIIDHVHQISGGKGYMAKSKIGRYCRDARAITLMRPYVPLDEWVDFLTDFSVSGKKK